MTLPSGKKPRRVTARQGADATAAAPLAALAADRKPRRAARRESASWFASIPPEPKPGEPLGLYAYRVLREGLRLGHLKPGEHLREAEVADWLRISRTPIREAMRRIASEGLLAVGPWNGMVVADFSSQQLVQLYAVREVLEGSAAALAARHAAPAEVEVLRSIAASEMAAAGDPDRLVSLNAELHFTIYNAAHNPFLLQALNTVVDALGLVRHSTFVIPGSIDAAHRDHLAIIEAIAQGEPEQAERLARGHVRNSLALRLRLQREQSIEKRSEPPAE